MDDLGHEPTEKRDPMVGMRLGDYLIEAWLGAGGMGFLYRGVQPVIGKAVAIKILQEEYARRPAETKRLLDEARAVNAIRHRGIVDIFTSGQLPDGRPYLVMELLEGEPLDEVIARHAPLPAGTVVQYLDEVLDAVGAAHGTGVIHRDLKPSNIFAVSPARGAPYLKVLDFGLAKRGQPTGEVAQSSTNLLVGTPHYMAPEQARGAPVGPWTDLYSLGCMAFEMLTGKVPFEGATGMETISLHLSAPVPRASSLAPGVPAALDALVFRLMQKDSADRPRTAEAVREELEEIRAGLPPTGPTRANSRPPPLTRHVSLPAAAAGRAQSHEEPTLVRPSQRAASHEEAPGSRPRAGGRQALWLGLAATVVAGSAAAMIVWRGERTRVAPDVALSVVPPPVAAPPVDPKPKTPVVDPEAAAPSGPPATPAPLGVQAAAPKKHEPISRPKRAPPADEARPPSRSELLARVDRRLARYQQLQSEGIDYVRVGETILRGQVRLEIERASDARSLLAAAKQLEEWESIYGSSL